MPETCLPLTLALQVVQEYERAVIFRLGRLLADGSRGPGTQRAVAAPRVNSPSASLIPLSLSLPLQKCITKTAAAPVMIFFLAPDAQYCPPARAPSLSRYPERTILPLFPFSFHSLHSGVRMSVVGGCVSAALLHTTFDHLDSDSGAPSPIRIDLQAFSSCSPALRTTPKSTSELQSLISLRKRLAPFTAIHRLS